MLGGGVTLVLEGLSVNRQQFSSSPIPRFLALVSGSLHRAFSRDMAEIGLVLLKVSRMDRLGLTGLLAFNSCCDLAHVSKE